MKEVAMKRSWFALGIVLTVAAISLTVAAMYLLRGAPISEMASASTPVPQTGVEITYIANEGVLLASGDKQVLIDGLHRNDRTFSHYAFLPTAERKRIETAKAPFDKIDLLLFSHRHYDHFHAEAAGLHLQHNPNTLLVSSQQVVSDADAFIRDGNRDEAFLWLHADRDLLARAGIFGRKLRRTKGGSVSVRRRI
jgi:glyoxylase-like metal-dependent hydrolase (beta-lactamase superfamily II)